MFVKMAGIPQTVVILPDIAFFIKLQQVQQDILQLPTHLANDPRMGVALVVLLGGLLQEPVVTIEELPTPLVVTPPQVTTPDITTLDELIRSLHDDKPKK
ncbi:Aste57867_1259 [Aphanomyces stellatus]|uniref:Aste57867_1259 protein n=1 Tax=Aphanomyces stellatus TaxID=120398 RepID=A0A485K4Q2_9STRA|nr:hypothetical protein As57867_001258 [Aphanomyces stellatus]VFT78478.1 Aste57867_1259 [Aphanomyces stellatus]